jgi:mannose-1-phosphate guanylyltransferase/mannose-6-phosphate isomerase
MSLHPVILCGGSGTRLWPASRADRPKQFLKFWDGRSSFQETLLRLQGLEGASRAIIVTGPALLDFVLEQSAEVGIDPIVLVEPQARDSAPAIAAAAAFVEQTDPAGVLLMLAADHHVKDAAAFRASAGIAVGAARAGKIATFGIHPDHPATGYGYIQPGDMIMEGVFAVARFVEKPNQATAQTYLTDGYLWNSGNFAFRADVLLTELTAFEPQIAQAARESVSGASITGSTLRLEPEAFARAPKISLDYAVMERTRLAAVVPAGFDWSDLGAWDAIWQASPRDEAGNSVQGDVDLSGARNTLVRSSGPFVSVMGVSDLIVVVEGDAVLVAHHGHAQEVKRVVDGLKADGRGIASRHRAARASLAKEGEASVELWRLDAGERADMPPAQVTVLTGTVRDQDGALHGPGSRIDCEAAQVMEAESPSSLLVTVWAA